MGKLPYQLITNTVSFLGEYSLIKVSEGLSSGLATEVFASTSTKYSGAMLPHQISRTE